MHADRADSELRAAFRELRPFAMRAFAFSGVASLLVLAPSWYMLEVYDRVVYSRNPWTLSMLTVAVLIAYAVMEALEWLRSQIAFSAATSFDHRLGARVCQAAFDAKRKQIPGGLQALQDLHTLRQFIQSQVPLAAMETPTAVVFLALVFAINPLLGGVAMLAAALQLLVGWLNQRGTRALLREANSRGFAAQQYAEQMAQHAALIAAMGMTGNVQRRWTADQQAAISLQAEASRVGSVFQSGSRMLQNLVMSTLLGLSCWLLLRDDLHGGPGMLIIAGLLGSRVLAPFILVITQWESVVAAKDAAARLDALLTTLPAPASGMPMPAPRGEVAVDNVIATLPGSSAPVLKGIHFTLAPGEVMVVMGPSGAGKTSLARVLLGLWPAASGKVRLDGVDVFTWNKQELGPHVGYVPQQVDLLEGTLAENIARFGVINRHAVESAARAVGLHEFIESLPQGYATWLGPQGCTLSGGQRQRVALARALYADPALVVLDEPNSGLDEAGDAALAAAIAASKQRGCTFVVMSHRASVLAIADKLLLLRDGHQHACGPREDVMAAIRQAQAQARDSAQQAASPGPSRRTVAVANG